MTTTDPAPGTKRAAMRDEQRHLLLVHERVEHLRRRAAERAAAAAADRSGATFQARYERDVTAHHQAARAARYTFGDLETLVFGRLDRGDGDTLHVGRVSVVDAEGDSLLVDWRAPAAAPFYQATPARPEGVARRRTLVSEGRDLHDLDDEILDARAAERLGLVAVTGQGALLASLDRVRTGHMRDIVATIQADQDRIIRTPATGTVIVRGGPGTGKTVVALHRVAYLLYTHRERFEGRGVLVVGPSGAFTEYISRVLPSLGEDRAVLRPLAAFAPAGATVDGWDEPELAALKGDLRMVEVVRDLLARCLPPLPPETRFAFDGTPATATAGELGRARARLLGRLDADREAAAYHARAGDAEQAMMRVLWQVWRSARRASGGEAPAAGTEAEFSAAVADAPQVAMLRRCFWPPRTPFDVLAPLAQGDRDALGPVGSDLLGDDEVAALADTYAHQDGWTVDDVALLDEARALLGAPSRTRPVREDADGIRLSVEADEVSVDRPSVDDPDYADFAHIVVDEAQDLTPMQWRMVARRGRFASWTVVGDLAQRSRVAEPRTWQDVAQLIGRRQVVVTELGVNYRTPVEIVEVAREVLRLAGHDPAEAPESVRTAGEAPVLLRGNDVVAAAAARTHRLLSRRDGMVGIVSPPDLVGPLRAAVAGGAGAADRVRVLDPRTVKGLEFDDVVVVAPDRIADASAVGLHQLYVAVTRATRSLTLVAAEGAWVPGAALLARADAVA